MRFNLDSSDPVNMVNRVNSVVCLYDVFNRSHDNVSEKPVFTKD